MFEFEFAPQNAGDVKQVVDELGLQFGVALNGGKSPLGFGVVELAGLQQSRPAQDGVERRSQLMGEGWPETRL